MEISMRCLRLCCFLLPLAALSVLGQEPVSPPPAVVGSGAQNPAADGPVSPAHIGGPVVAPKVIYKVDPKYSEEARREKFSGTVRVYMWVDKNGNPSHVKVIQPVGHDLDEKAVEAVRQYKFQPATLNGDPVVVDLYIDVSFRIFDNHSPS